MKTLEAEGAEFESRLLLFSGTMILTQILEFPVAWLTHVENGLTNSTFNQRSFVDIERHNVYRSLNTLLYS